MSLPLMDIRAVLNAVKADGKPLRSVDELPDVHARFLAGNHKPAQRPSPDTLVARVEHGRWLADCPACESGIALAPGHPGRCFGCGFVYPHVEWPPIADRELIVALLEERPARVTQNWTPGETVDELRSDNLMLQKAKAEVRLQRGRVVRPQRKS